MKLFAIALLFIVGCVPWTAGQQYAPSAYPTPTPYYGFARDLTQGALPKLYVMTTYGSRPNDEVVTIFDKYPKHYVGECYSPEVLNQWPQGSLHYKAGEAFVPSSSCARALIYAFLPPQANVCLFLVSPSGVIITNYSAQTNCLARDNRDGSYTLTYIGATARHTR